MFINKTSRTLLLVFVFLVNITFAIPIQITIGTYFADIVIENDGNIFKYGVIKALDKKFDTTLALNGTPINYYTRNVGFTTKETITINQIIIYNGFQKNEDTYQKNQRLKNIQIIVYDSNNKKYIKKDKYNEQIPNYVFDFHLKDTKEPQILNLPERIKGDNWGIKILSTYPGTKYTDICISEIEFYYKGVDMINILGRVSDN